MESINVLLPEKNLFRDSVPYLDNLNLFGNVGHVVNNEALNRKRNKYVCQLNLKDFIKPIGFMQLVERKLHLSVVDEFSFKSYECLIDLPEDVNEGDIFSYLRDKKMTIVLPRNIVGNSS
ncbi:MAG: Hsp20/alpha crystallin family protein [Flavobacteriales bacterium]|nr:Hsp20/alpha crystallin family protein [Flavobacteriales bacterium]